MRWSAGPRWAWCSSVRRTSPISGKAQIVDDPELRTAAWPQNDAVWWPGGPNDPDARVLVVEPTTAELWDGPSSAVVAAYEFAKARVTGTEPDLGDNRKVAITLCLNIHPRSDRAHKCRAREHGTARVRQVHGWRQGDRASDVDEGDLKMLTQVVVSERNLEVA